MAIVERRVEILANHDDDYVWSHPAALPGAFLELRKFRVERVHDLPVSTVVIGCCVLFGRLDKKGQIKSRETPVVEVSVKIEEVLVVKL
jgi:hypothetical protein